MAPKKGKGKKPVAPSRPPPPVAPAVGRSIILNLECLVKLSQALATAFNECGKTTAWPTYHFPTDRIITEVHYFADALWEGLVPPFSDFFNAVLTHYQIHMMHLGPESIALLSVFAFVCEKRWWASFLPLPCYAISSPCILPTPRNARHA